MRVYIGPYRNHYSFYKFLRFLERFKVPESFVDKIDDKFGKYFDKAFNLLNRKRKIKVRIDDYDSWGADHTLSLIIHPILLKVLESKQGAPFVDDADVPDGLKSTNAPKKENEWDTDGHHFKRWEYVLGEMIFAFEKIKSDDWESEFFSGKSEIVEKLINPEEPDPEKWFYTYEKGPNHTFEVDREGMKKVQDRINNGLRLFGKYYESLWT